MDRTQTRFGSLARCQWRWIGTGSCAAFAVFVYGLPFHPTPLFAVGAAASKRGRHGYAEPARTSLKFRFQSMGPIPRSEPMQQVCPYAMVRYISPDGNAVAGVADEQFGDNVKRTGAQHAFVWSQRSGLNDVGEAIGRQYSSTINTASDDGQAVAGTWSGPYSTSQFVRYADGTLISDLQIPSENGHAVPARYLMSGAFSPDGRYFVGTTGRQTYRWAENAEPVLIPELTGAKVAAVGQECRWIIGSRNGSGFVWTPEAGVVELGPRPVPYGTTMQSASRNGRFVVGNHGNDLLLWSAATGLEKIGELPWDDKQTIAPFVYRLPTPFANKVRTIPEQKPFGMAYYPSLHISDDGKTIVGQSQALHTRQMTPFLWTKQDGMLLIREILESSGAPAGLADMHVEAVALSPEASYITGLSCDSRGNLIRWRLHIQR